MFAFDENSSMRSEPLLTTNSGSSSLIRRPLVAFSSVKCTARFFGFVFTTFAARELAILTQYGDPLS